MISSWGVLEAWKINPSVILIESRDCNILKFLKYMGYKGWFPNIYAVTVNYWMHAHLSRGESHWESQFITLEKMPSTTSNSPLAHQKLKPDFPLFRVNNVDSAETPMCPQWYTDTHTLNEPKHRRICLANTKSRKGLVSGVLHRIFLGLAGSVCACKPHAANEEVHCGVDR